MKKIDKEYSTQWVEEMKFLKRNGIPYSFVKEINGITTYKYQKTKELFQLLSCFYDREEVLDNECSKTNNGNRIKADI